MKKITWLLSALSYLSFSFVSVSAQPTCLGLQTEWLLKGNTTETREQFIQRLAYEQQALGQDQEPPQILPHPEADHLLLCLSENYPLMQVLAKRQKKSHFEIRQPMKGTPNFWAPTGLNGSHMLKVTLKKQPEPGVEIQLDPAGSQIFARLSVGLLKQKMGLYLNEQLLMAPHVMSVIADGRILISGSDLAAMENLAQKLELARLPWPDVELLAIEIGQYSAALQKQVPPELQALLNKHYPGWYFPKGLSAIGQEHYWQEKPPFTPFWIKGDFDGNGTEDHALQIRHPAGKEGSRETILILSRQNPNPGQNTAQYLPLVLDQTAPAHLRSWSGASLWRYPTGSKMYNFETEKEFNTPHETLALHFWGKGAMAWIWDGASFKDVTIGD
ncbi:MAG: hypothetical protein AB7I41_05475 [Candidatus Sericytochromatia bacterium]